MVGSCLVGVFKRSAVVASLFSEASETQVRIRVGWLFLDDCLVEFGCLSDLPLLLIQPGLVELHRDQDRLDSQIFFCIKQSFTIGLSFLQKEKSFAVLVIFDQQNSQVVQQLARNHLLCLLFVQLRISIGALPLLNKLLRLSDLVSNDLDALLVMQKSLFRISLLKQSCYFEVCFKVTWV